MTNLSRVNKVLEIFWWSMAAVTLILVIIMCVLQGWDKWMWYFIIPFLAALMALVRRFMSNRLAKSEAIKQANKNAKKKKK